METMKYSDISIVLPERLIDAETGFPMIPKISDEELLSLYEKLKPIITIKDFKYLLREYTLHEIKNTSYIWKAEDNLKEKVDPKSLTTVDEFPCLHGFGYYGFFKPSVGEILSQIPEGLENEASLFEIIEEPKTREDIFRYPEIVNNGYHLSRVRAYKKK